MKLYYIRETYTAYSTPLKAMTSLAELSPEDIAKLADNYAYYDYVADLPINETPVSKLKYVLDRAEDLFADAEPEDSPFWMIETVI